MQLLPPNGWSLPVFHRGVGSGKCCSQNWEETKCSPGKGWEFDKLPNWTSTRPKESKKRITSVCFLFASCLSILFNCLFLFARCFRISRYFYVCDVMFLSFERSEICCSLIYWNHQGGRCNPGTIWAIHPELSSIEYMTVSSHYTVPNGPIAYSITRMPGPKSTWVYLDSHVVLH